SSVLTIRVPLGLQYGTNQTGVITNRGNLSAGQGLTLSAGNLDLQGQLLAGQDLTLEAQDTVQIRDSVTVPFIAAAGEQLLVQGKEAVDIFALNHPDSGLFSAGDMVLRSASPVLGDAHYWSGGSFRIEQLDGSLGGLESPNDPIIRSLGDVNFNNYIGTSLHILAGGEVNIGTVIITGPEIGVLGADFIRETVQLSDGTETSIDGSIQPTLDVRAGMTAAAVGIPSITGFDNFPIDFFVDPTFSFLELPPNLNNPATSADITIGDILFLRFQDGGKVFLTNQYQPNLLLDTHSSITVGSIDVTDDLGGGSVIIDSRGSITLNGTVDVSALDVFAGNGGDIKLIADGNIILKLGANIISNGLLGGNISFDSEGDISIANSLIQTANFTNEAGVTGGEIQVTANSLSLIEGTRLDTVTLGRGNAGAVKIAVNDLVQLDGESNTGNSSRILSRVFQGAEGNSGRIELTTGSLELTNGARLSTSTEGIGDAGVVKITATDSVRLDGESSNGFVSSISSHVSPGAEGNSGRIELTTSSLELLNGAQVDASTSGIGDAGAVKITAINSVQLDGESSNGFSSGVFSKVVPRAEGNSGGIELTTYSLELTNGAGVSASTGGIGDAGAVKITATDSVRLDGESRDRITSGIVSQVAPEAKGNSEGIELTTASLKLTNGARLSASTFGIGNAGAVRITATDSMLLDGEDSDGFVSGIFSIVASEAKGNSRGIELTTTSLELTNGAVVSASTGGIGNAGAVKITATDSMRLDGESSNGFVSGIFSTVASETKGNSRGIELTTTSLELTNGAVVSASTGGIGNASAVKITATDSMRLDGESSNGFVSGIFSTVAPEAKGNSGGIELTTTSLELTNGVQVEASTFGLGNAGAVKITATDSMRLDGESSNGSPSVVLSQVKQGAEGNSGGIELTTSSLKLTNGAFLSTSTFGLGNAGLVKINATNSVQLDGEGNDGFSSGIVSRVAPEAKGNSGRIELTTASLELTNGAQVSTSTFGVGDAGIVKITATDLVRLDGKDSNEIPSAISNMVGFEAEGNSGRIELTTSSLELTRSGTRYTQG
ncbi:MAG: S-layer family protein, partial [Symploca sp. SIO1B1]|nr:S-layer family protein [Symploca sp. SIO1B1]